MNANPQPFDASTLSLEKVEQLVNNYIITVAKSPFKSLYLNDGVYYLYNEDKERVGRFGYLYDAVRAYNNL